MSVDRNKGIFRWVGFLWLLIHRAKASECFCTLGDSSTPVHSQPNAVSETVGFMESKTCFHGNFVPGMQWLQVDKTDIFIRKDSLTACPDGLVKTITDSLNQAQCDFEVNSFCSWRNIQGGHDDFDWVMYHSSTPTDDTGPTFDHTLNNATGTYIFIESSAPRSTFDTAWIQSPQIDAKNVPVHCFRFWYHMYGSSIGGLNVYQVTNGSLPGNLVWSLTGDQGSTWMEGQVPLSSNHSYSMLISGIVGNGYQGDIAIDDVSVSPGYCDVKPSNASRTDVTNTVDGYWGLWSNWSRCDVTCGDGTRTRNRSCVGNANGGQNCSGDALRTEACHTGKCPVDGAWGQWANWSVCNCITNTQARVRKCDSPAPVALGQQCPGYSWDTPGYSWDTMSCTDKPTTCPVDGQWGGWYPWSVCSTTCGPGETLRFRVCNNPRPQNGGLYCDSHEKAEEERMGCQGPPCPTIQCTLCKVNQQLCMFLTKVEMCPDSYCINEVTNTANGSKWVDRRCGTLDECENDWWHSTSDDPDCQDYKPNENTEKDIHCTYCCTTDNCNADIKPAQYTLYTHPKK